MKKQKTKEEIIQHKKASIRKLNNLLENYLASNDYTLLKKTDLISYWLETFSDYIGSETTFDSNKLIRYNRGNVIRVNLGFNIGKELGGLHYAVVLDNDNKRNADVITVVPLSSTEGRNVHPRSVDLGTEIYEKVSVVQSKMIEEAEKELTEFTDSYNFITSTLEALKKATKEHFHSDSLTDLSEKLDIAIQHQMTLQEKEKHIEQRIEILKRNDYEIQKMKLGSMAVCNQITTISKQRIYVPKRSCDFLYGISLSTPAMEKINSKIKELYIF